MSEESLAAESSAEAGRVVVVCGLPGAGKTTVAERVTDRVGATRLRTDVIRKELFSAPEYTDEESAAVYDELFARTRRLVADGDPVVLDATFSDRANRERARDLAATLDAPFDLVEVVCAESVVEQRIRRRTDDESDADVEVHRTFRDLFDPIEGEHVVVDNSGDLSATHRQVDQQFY